MNQAEAIVVGSGPNGLAAAIAIAQTGRKVIVFEAEAQPGGGVRSAALTLPGFVHDVCSAVYPFAITSPFFRTLPLEAHGLAWIEPPIMLAHPQDDGTCASVYRSIDRTIEELGEDGAAYRRLIGSVVDRWPLIEEAVLGPPRMPRHPIALAAFGMSALQAAAPLARRTFTRAGTRALFAGVAAHGMMPLDRRPTAAFALVLGAMAHVAGWVVPRGGAQQLTEALAAHLRSLGGEIVTSARIGSVDDLPSARAVLCDLSPRPLLAVAGHRFPASYRRALERYRYGVGAFKVDWALDAPIPWRAEACTRACTVHVGGTLEEIADAERQSWAGRPAERPFVLLVQPSLFDPTRAPDGRHTAWAYCHVPHRSTADMLAPIEQQIERFAPGFRDRILARSVRTPADIERGNANLVGGDIGAGVSDLRAARRSADMAHLLDARARPLHLFGGHAARRRRARHVRLPRGSARARRRAAIGGAPAAATAGALDRTPGRARSHARPPAPYIRTRFVPKYRTRIFMSWLLLGILYSFAYIAVGFLLRGQPTVLGWFRAAALLVPPMAGALVIVHRRQVWRGCQWLFWATIALGLSMSAIGLTGWAADELMFARDTWLAWPAVFALFGGVAPLFALLAQPHRGAREPLAATTAIDIAGLAVVTGFLYSFFVVGPEASSAGEMSSPLKLVSELQQLLVMVAMVAATLVARQTPWRATYKRLALGAVVSFATLTLSNIEITQTLYRSGFVYDFTWILPFAFFPWAASAAPASTDADSTDGREETDERTRPRPWVIFTAVALLPFLDLGLRRLLPDDTATGFRDLTTAVTLMSVLPLLVARIAAERAELQQASSTTRLLAQVIEQARDLILVLTPDGRCRHANAAFCRAVGRSKEELATLTARELLAHETLTAGDIQSTAREGGAWRGTVMRTRKDGTTFPVSASVVPVVDDRGTATHVVSVEQDISEERRLREQLIHSERLSAVGQLVAGVAHEINNPLQAVMGFTELLIETEDRPNVRADLEQIRTDARRAAKIVHNLLVFARRETLERSVADVNELVRTTLALRSFELRSGPVRLEQQYGDDVPMIVANREQVQQVIVNLLLNAEHALRALRRPGVVTIRTGRHGDAAFIEVADDGAGVRPDVAGRIFEPFFTTKPLGEGTGLGLSVSLGIAEAHEGSLALVPSERGACFRLTLPGAGAAAVGTLDRPDLSGPARTAEAAQSA